MNRHYPAVAARARRRCEYCRAPELLFNFPFDVEHIFPSSRGGSDSSDNLALACRSCNLFKSDTVDSDNDPLFQPRTDNWFAHFRFDEESGRIEGLTDVGIRTVEQLRLNDPIAIIARMQWVSLKLFP